MTTANPIPADQLAKLANTDIQRLAARMAQDVFAGVFRQAAVTDAAPDVGVLGEVAAHCYDWCQAAASDEARALRLAMLISGLDQWGLAYTQAFKLDAIHPLTALIGGLRTRLDARNDMLFQKYFEQIDVVESDAIDFKVDLRRGIHLALWHAMAACETAEQIEAIVQALGSMMLALNQQMPELGWRLLADALANIQIALLSDVVPESAQAQEGTQQLFASLRHALPQERYQAILAHSGQAVVAWQQASRVKKD
ncbi:hypothetical protein [Ferribacterium limneticum]|uniref:hypothetical protein n=1 Tax=Ferribacterium limneticum TaxID=76259 RepID=UPI001CFC441E|nr:hypothetical protein [Ferribacterium limneticum]UCV28930.1 hypothetical protein KI617_02155 [Ferribacterium limneticum]UCV32848.1 hypothetical protein KI608_02155 [Ferribacterium limneticum]